MKTSELELKFDFMCGVYGIPPFEKEHRFHPTRRWRFDRALIEDKIAVEIDGGIWNAGRHVRGKGYAQDCDKLNAATALGWRVFKATTEQINVGPDSFFPLLKSTIEDVQQNPASA